MLAWDKGSGVLRRAVLGPCRKELIPAPEHSSCHPYLAPGHGLYGRLGPGLRTYVHEGVGRS